MEVGGSLTCPAGIIAARLGEVWGDGDEENTLLCHTLTHNLHFSRSLSLSLFLMSVSNVCVFQGVSPGLSAFSLPHNMYACVCAFRQVWGQRGFKHTRSLISSLVI